MDAQIIVGLVGTIALLGVGAGSAIFFARSALKDMERLEKLKDK